jgi:hypothetical protein
VANEPDPGVDEIVSEVPFTRHPAEALEPARDPEVISSRRALIDVIVGLAAHSDALTVLGGHAVIEVTQDIPNLPPDDTTSDGDLGVTPELLGDDPKIGERMAELGYEAARPERPGIWSPISQRDRDIHQRDSVDLIAPLEVAYPPGTRRPTRGARVGAHGAHAVSATRGTELSVIDRRRMMLRSFDDGPGVEVNVAGPAALLCAKAYKLHDRMDLRELRRNGERLRSKDFADLYRLTLAISPEDARAVFTEGENTDRIGQAVKLGREYLLEILDDEEDVAVRVADAWGDVSQESAFREHIANWRERFRAEVGQQ